MTKIHAPGTKIHGKIVTILEDLGLGFTMVEIDGEIVTVPSDNIKDVPNVEE